MTARPATDEELNLLDAYWRAANYLSVGQIYLLDNPLLREPLQPEHIKPRLLGHWGTTPGLNLLYAHFNRIICQRDVNMIYVTGPGHGGPGLLANVWLEGTYSEVYPSIEPDAMGMQRLFRQFSFPGGVPSHVAPETPGSINEGGELGYSLFHAYGAVLDNPSLVAACVIGDGEAETGALATSWHSNKFLDPSACRTVTCHLGAGASLCAVDRGTSVDTTMGFTPLEGLVMATRSGDVDPGLVLWLIDREGLDPATVQAALEHQSGLVGLAGDGDMRAVLARADAGDPDARLALDVYVHRLAGSVAAMAASLGGLDLLVFTAGVGEHAAVVRERAAAALAFLGVAVSPEANAAASADADITAPGASVKTVVVTAREDVEMARQARALLNT